LTRSEKFLAKERIPGIKEILLGRLTIPRTNKEINEKTNEGKNLMKIPDLNDLAYKE
jgi:hypothetical protein